MVHTVRLLKYNSQKGVIHGVSKIKRWTFILLYAGQYGPEPLRMLLPDLDFDRANRGVRQDVQQGKEGSFS